MILLTTLVTKTNPLRELLRLVDKAELDTDHNQSSEFRSDVNGRMETVDRLENNQKQ